MLNLRETSFEALLFSRLSRRWRQRPGLSSSLNDNVGCSVAPPQVCGNILMLQYDSIEWKVQHFYESCKSLEYIEADREKPLLKIINNLGGETTATTLNIGCGGGAPTRAS